MSTDNNETNETSVETNEVSSQEQETTQETNTTQDETTETEAKTFDADYVQKLRSEAAEKRTALKSVTDELNALKTKFAESQEKLNEANSLIIANTRKLIATQHGLSEELASRLQGNTEEELVEDAKKLQSLVGGINVGQEGEPLKEKPSSRNNYYLNLARKQ